MRFDILPGKKKAYNTPGSQVVSHPSTRRACRSLTSQIGRDAVYSPKYGPCRSLTSQIGRDAVYSPKYGRKRKLIATK
eukprot:gene9399-biopygen34